MTLIKPRSAALALSLALVSVSAHAQDLTINAGETYINAGTLNNNIGDTLTNNGQLTNSNNGTLISTGTLINASSGTVSVFGGIVDATTIDNNGTFNFTGGILNVDTFNGDLNNTGGILGPGHSPGTTTINGDYSQDATSTLLIEIEGLLAGKDYDVLNVTGTATLDGILEFDVDYSALLLGDSFNILNADVISGTFASITNRRINIDWRWELNYQVDFSGSTDVLTATVAAVPIPAAVWLFGSGLGLLGWVRRKGRQFPAVTVYSVNHV
jgi:hypothetical protein